MNAEETEILRSVLFWATQFLLGLNKSQRIKDVLSEDGHSIWAQLADYINMHAQMRTVDDGGGHLTGPSLRERLYRR